MRLLDECSGSGMIEWNGRKTTYTVSILPGHQVPKPGFWEELSGSD